jgi:glycosyltransferase involved in cell wall biosynthesis
MTSLVVLLPVYKDARGLGISLRSLGRADGEFDVVVVDDGSPEPAAAQSLLENGNGVITLRLERNAGIAVALNHGLRYILERGYQHVARLDSADTIAPDRFMRQVRFLEENPAYAAVSSFVDFVDPEGAILFRHRAPCSPRRILRRMHVENCMMHPGVMLRSSVLDDFGLYREDVPGAEDYELFLRLAKKHKLGVLPHVLTRCEYSRKGLSIAGRRRQQIERLRLQLRYFDAASPWSYYGLGRTLLGMLSPHAAVFRWKQTVSRLTT